MDILTRLKADTRISHQQTEQLLYVDKLMAGTLARFEYEHLLTIHYSFHYALEKAIAEQATFFSDYNLNARRKTPWLAADLRQLGVLLPATSSALFGNWTGYQLLGAMYVAEGSMLGGRVIINALLKMPALQGLNYQFFTGYGEQTGSFWKAFGTYLTHQAIGHDDEVGDGARKAFGLFQTVATRP